MGMYMLSRNIDPEQLLGIFVGIMIVCVISCIVMTVLKRKSDAENARLPIRREMAMVVEKEQLPPDAIPAFSNPWILFELQDGRRVRVNGNYTHSDLILGDVGMLTWQGNRIVSFSRNTGNGQAGQRPVQPSAAAPEQVPGYTPAPHRNPASQEAKVTADTEIIFCSRCGRKQRKSNTVCWDCGAELK